MKTPIFVLISSLCCLAAAQWNNAPPAGIPVKFGAYIPVSALNTTNNSRPNNFSYPNHNQPQQAPTNYGWNKNLPQQQQQQNFGQGYQPPVQPNFGNVYQPQVQPNFGNGLQRSFDQNNKTSGHDVTIGSRQPGDELLFKTFVTKPLSTFSRRTSKDIVFPDPNSRKTIKYITQIVVLDNSKNRRDGGTTQIKSGGVGKSKVEIHFKSLTNKNLDVQLQVYGYDN